MRTLELIGRFTGRDPVPIHAILTTSGRLSWRS